MIIPTSGTQYRNTSIIPEYKHNSGICAFIIPAYFEAYTVTNNIQLDISKQISILSH